MEKGTDQDAIMYHRSDKHLSWIVLDEYIYAHLCHSLHIDRDFVLIDRNSNLFKHDQKLFELVRRKIPPVAEPTSTQAELDEQLDNTIVSEIK